MMLATLLTLRIPDFDAAVRTAVEPRLAERPVVVVTAFKPLGRVIAASPAARAAGVDAETPYPLARARCPDAAFFVPDKELAGRAARAMAAKAAEYSPLVEPAGDGRVLLDTRGTEKLWGAGLNVAERLRADLRRDLRLPASAGLASYRPWSHLASRAAGDDGSWWVVPGQENVFLDLAPTAWIDGIGLRTRERLAELNIRSIGQLRQFPFSEMAQQFGPRCGRTLWRVLSPDDWNAAPVASHTQADDFENTVRARAVIPEASASLERLRVVARTLAGEAAAELRRRGKGAAWLRLSLLYIDGVTHGARQRTSGFIQAEDTLASLAEVLLEKAFTRRVAATQCWIDAEKLGEPLRQGVLFDFADPVAATPAAAPSRPDASRHRLHHAVDAIRRRHGDAAITPALLMPHGGPAPAPPARAWRTKR